MLPMRLFGRNVQMATTGFRGASRSGRVTDMRMFVNVVSRAGGGILRNCRSCRESAGVPTSPGRQAARRARGRKSVKGRGGHRLGGAEAVANGVLSADNIAS